MPKDSGFTPQDKGMMEQVSDPAAVAELERIKEREIEAMKVAKNDDEVTTEVYDNDKVDDLVDGEYMEDENDEVLMEGKVLGPGEPILESSRQKVSIGRVVVYRSRTGNYSVPAIVTCTVDSIYQPGVEHGFVPALSESDNVHLTVFSPGRPGLRQAAGNDQPVAGAESFVNPSKYPIGENVSGCYQEWDIPYDPNGGPGTWSWPARV